MHIAKSWRFSSRDERYVSRYALSAFVGQLAELSHPLATLEQIKEVAMEPGGKET